MLLRACQIYPVSSPSIEDGFVRLDGGCITEIGPWSECSNQSEAEDLGEVILMRFGKYPLSFGLYGLCRSYSLGLLVHGLDSGHR